MNYFSKRSRDETVKMKSRQRESNFLPVKRHSVGIRFRLTLCEAAELMVLAWRGTGIHPAGRVMVLGN